MSESVYEITLTAIQSYVSQQGADVDIKDPLVDALSSGFAHHMAAFSKSRLAQPKHNLGTIQNEYFETMIGLASNYLVLIGSHIGVENPTDFAAGYFSYMKGAYQDERDI